MNIVRHIWIAAATLSTCVTNAWAQCDSALVAEAVKKADDQVWADHPKAMVLSLEAVKMFSGTASACEAKTNLVLGKTLWSNGDYAQSIEVLHKAIAHARKAGDVETQARSELVMANNFYYQAYYDSAEHYFVACRQSFLRLKHRRGQIEVLHDMALMFHRKGDFKASLKYLLESEQLKEQEPDFVHYVGDFTGISTGFNDSLYYRQEITDELNSLRNFQIAGNQDGVYQSLINLGIAYRELGDHRTSARYFVSGSRHMAALGIYPFWDQAGVAYSRAQIEDSCFYFHYKAKSEFARATKIKILYTYELLGDAHLQFGHSDSAQWYYEKSLAMNVAMNNRLTIPSLHLSLAKLYLTRKMIPQAQDHFMQAVEGAREISVKLASKCYQFAADLYRTSAPSKALEYAIRYQNLADSINRNENAMEMVRFQTQFETARKERELVAAKLQLKNRTTTMLSLASITALALAFVVILYLQQAKIKKQNKRLSESNSEQKALMQEIHHRVKNNLQYVASLLSLQMPHMNSEEIVSQMEEIRTRIITIGLIHQNLYQSNSMQYVDLTDFIGDLVRNIFQAFPTRAALKEEIQVVPISVDLDSAISIGLLVNELTINSLKHALIAHTNPVYALHVSVNGGVLRVMTRDNGPGFDISERTTGFGMRLVGLLIKKLQGQIAQPDRNTLEIEIRNFKTRPLI